MKKNNKSIGLLILLLLSFLIICPYNTFALTKESSDVYVGDVTNIEVGDLLFSNIMFKKSISTTNQTFGLSGSIINKANNQVYYNSVIYYYDSNNNLLTKDKVSNNASLGTSIFNHETPLSLLGNHDTSEIAYYRWLIEIPNNSVSNNISTSFTPSKNYMYSSLEYVIDKYHVDIIVNENNTFDITENITAYFNVSKHGIFRTIPLKNTITRLDGTISTNRARVTDISVDNEYTTSRENGNYKLKIGSAYRTLTGEQSYVIKYKYNIGKDPIKNNDEFYYNIIGNEWDTVIGNVTFRITMPKEFDSSKLGFSSGGKGSIDNSKIEYNVDGNVISGKYNGILSTGEALTIRCELEEGYFVGAGLKINIMSYIFFLIPLIFLAIAILLWYKYGRDNQVIETVEFYPPQGFNSLEVGFLYKGKANNQDVISLLIYLANQGYIKITETEEKSLFSKTKGFKITKLKEYDGNNINEKIFLNGLFSKKQHFTSLFGKKPETPSDNIDEVSSIDLYDNFYITIDRILINMNNKENNSKLFEKSTSSKSLFILLMIIATFCMITILPILTYGETELLVVALLFPGIGFTLMICMLLGDDETIYVNGRATRSKIGTKLFALVWGGMFGGVPWAITVLPVLLQDLTYFIGYIIGLICVLGMILCLKYLPKRTSYGNEILGKIKGFKKFLETAEKDKLESMVMYDSSYFYNILPYTYVLGVSDKWIKKFESISLQAPSWYDSPNAFNMVAFGSFMNNTMTSAESVMSSSPSSGGSSGGGSSGGGSGGGGGGSW